MLAVGLMSGTSLDGVDAALVEITGVNETTTVKLLEFITCKLLPDVKERIKLALSTETSDVRLISSLNFELGEIFAASVLGVCNKYEISPSKLDFIASHGQTIFHLPESNNLEYSRSTLQIGEPAIIAERTQTTVISNFRPRDMAVGGQGAPIVPYAEYILYRNDKKNRLLQNIGGIGNVTIIPAKSTINQLTAFDTGPGNMIIDELCRVFFEKEFDDHGKIAASGQINDDVLSELLKNEYYQLPAPKTTGRELFGQQYVQEIIAKYKLEPADWVATATALTAKSIADAVSPYCIGDTELIVGGGGSYNPTLLQLLKTYLPNNVTVLTQENLGMSSEAKEAIAMVILGNQTLHHQTSNVKSATGADKSVILGNVTYYN